ADNSPGGANLGQGRVVTNHNECQQNKMNSENQLPEGFLYCRHSAPPTLVALMVSYPSRDAKNCNSGVAVIRKMRLDALRDGLQGDSVPEPLHAVGQKPGHSLRIQGGRSSQLRPSRSTSARVGRMRPSISASISAIFRSMNSR